MAVELMTRHEAADCLGVSIRRVGQLLREGKLPRLANRLTRHVRIPRTAVLRLKHERNVYEPPAIPPGQPR